MITRIGEMNHYNELNQAAKKPVWNGNKVYTYLEDYSDAAISYGKQAARYYAGKTMQDGELTVDELKKQIGEMFSGYTLTDHEPGKVVSGKNYLYIDDSQLKKMASDPAYRAKVYGLMDREYTCSKSYTLKYSDGKNVTSHVTGSIFSLSEKNSKYEGPDGIPYLGSCQTDHPFSSSTSHCQVRSQSFLYEHLDPAKSAAKARKTAATKNETAKRLKKLQEKKKAEKKQEAEMLEKRKEAKKLRENMLEEQTDNRLETDSFMDDYFEDDYFMKYPAKGKSIDYSV